MLRRFIPTRSTELRRNTARERRVSSTMVPVPVLDVAPVTGAPDVDARALTPSPPHPQAPDQPARPHPSPLYDSPEIMTIPESEIIADPAALADLTDTAA